MDAKLQEVIAGKAPEYLEPLAALQENMQIRTKVAGRHVKWVLLFQQYKLAMHFKVSLFFFFCFGIVEGVCFKVRNTMA